MSEIKKCSICLNKLKSKKTLDCNHEFCLVCIINLLNYSKKCPLCRRKITNKEIRIIRNSQILTKSKTIYERNDEIKSILYIYVEKANNLSCNNNSIINYLNTIYKLLHNNLWFLKLKENNELKNVIKIKLDEFIKDGWKEGRIWKFKLRKYF